MNNQMEKFMPLKLKNQPITETKPSKHRLARWEWLSNQTQADDTNSVMQVTCEASPSLVARIWAVDLTREYWAVLSGSVSYSWDCAC